MDLDRLVSRATRPVALLGLLLLAVAVTLLLEDPAGHAQQYAALFWAAAGGAAVLLGTTAALPPHARARFRALGLGGGGVLLGALQGNGLSDGVARVLLLVAMLVVLVVAVAAVVVRLDSAQERPVNRL